MGIKFFSILFTLLIWIPKSWAAQEFYPEFGPEDEAEMVAPSRLWVKSPLSTVTTPLGKGQGQIIYRFFGGETTFKLGSISYYTFPKKSDHEDKKSPELVKQGLKKLYPDVDLHMEKIKDNVWAYTSEWKKGTYFIRVFYVQGKNSYSLISRQMRSRYLESTNMEAEWLQQKLIGRAQWFDQNGMKQASFEFPFKLIENAYAQGYPLNAYSPSCPPPSGYSTTLPSGCPSPGSCAAMANPVLKAQCLGNIQVCHNNMINRQIGNLQDQTQNIRGDVHCQSALMGYRIKDMEGYIDRKQIWMDQRILPLAQDMNGHVARGLDLAEKVTSLKYIAAAAATGVAAGAIASAGVNLLIEGVGQGLSALYGVISGKDEEERRQKESDAFIEAKKQWEELEDKMKALEESLSASVDAFGIIAASGKDLESLIAEVGKSQSDKEFELENVKNEYEKLKQQPANAENIACRRELFDSIKKIEGDLTSIAAIVKALDYAKSDYGTLKRFCEGLANDISKLLAKEYLLEKMRNKLSMYYASHLWVEQKESDKRNAERLKNSNPEENLKTELATAHNRFYEKVAMPTFDPNSGKKFDCNKVIVKAADKCRSENESWVAKVPLIGFFAGGNKSMAHCSSVQANLLVQPPSTSQTGQVKDPNGFRQLVTFYEQKFASKEVYRYDFDPSELSCVQGLIKNYNLYRSQVSRALENRREALRTWNYRRDQAIFEDDYARDVSSLIRNLNMESACGNIEAEDCLDNDMNCKEIQRKECKVSQLNYVCANMDESDPCKGHISPGCQTPDSKLVDYCKIQFENKKQCEQTFKTCQEKNIPVGCAKIDETSCSTLCQNLELKCSKAKNTDDKSCKELKKCQQKQTACVSKKKDCSKAAFSNINFRFGRLKGMRDYLKENSCKQF